MRHFVFTLCFILFFGNVFSQNCPPNGDIILLTQEQVDNFAADYPGCTVLDELQIGNSNGASSTITNLDGLSQLTSARLIKILVNPNLLNINGLQNITGQVDYIKISGNYILENLSGLEGITEVSDRFEINDNSALTNLVGLDNLATVSNTGFFSIQNNSMLSSLEGLNNLTSARNLSIRNNHNLIDLSALGNVNTLWKLDIRNNDGLTNLNGFGNIVNTPSNNFYVDIIDNDGLTDLTGLENVVNASNDLRLDIENNDALTNLVGLENIVNIPGNNVTITIEENDALTSLHGLHNMVDVDILRIVSNPLLANLEDIAQLTSVNALGIDNNDMLTSLSDLENISINSLGITGNDGLTDLSGLENITELRSLGISNNPNLVNLSGLENLTYIGGDIYSSRLNIVNNDALVDLSALSNLNHVERTISISYNAVLPNLTGLENIEGTSSFSRIFIRGNDLLSDISALDLLPNYLYISQLYIHDNPSLPMCSQSGICYYIASGRFANIYNNAPGCNSSDEVLNMCDITGLSCPVGDILLTSQSQVDSFAINYFNCNRIYGNLTVSSPSITNLNALFQIDTIDGDFTICDNPNLEDLEGLSSIHIGGDFWFKNNDAVYHLYNNFDFNDGVYILDNSNLRSIASMTYNMPNITYLQITGNHSLGFCTVPRLSGFDTPPFDDYTDMCNYLIAGEPSEIHSNYVGCNSAEEIITYCVTLPITLTYFQAKIDRKTTLLTWQTATETNNAGFEIQRSTDAVNWEKIAWQDGQGTTTNAHTYTHRDENPLFGTSYYRLKQVDFDGAFEYTHIVQVNYEGRDISIYPNPVKNTLHISDLNGENIQNICIYDQTGRIILSHQMPDNMIDVSALSSGMYILKIAVKDEVFCKKFIVQERK